VDLETLLLSAPWLTAGLWVAMYSADYLLTIASARAYRMGASDHYEFEVSLELNPGFVADVDAMRWFSPRFVRVLVLTTLIVGGVCLIGGPFLAPQNAGFRNPALFMLGALFFPEFSVCARHAGNLALFRPISVNTGMEGKVSYARWLTYEMSGVQLWGLACVLLVCALLGWKASLFGGAVGVGLLGLRNVQTSRVQLAKSLGLPRSRIAALRWRLPGLIVALLLGVTFWQSFPPTPPPPPPGTIWFGTGYDSGGPGLTGRGNTFTQGTTVWMTVDLDQPLSGGDGITVMIDGSSAISMPDDGLQVFSTAVPGGHGLGAHAVSIEDSTGTTRATGTFTITPAAADSPSQIPGS
jgi:hypothetical protein